MSSNHHHHCLLICFPSQGNINPSLQLAKRLINLNVQVTFVTAAAAARRMTKIQPTKGLDFATFDDGDIKPAADSHYFSELKRCGSQSLRNLMIDYQAGRRPPFTFVIYSLLLNWAADVATSFNIPSALFLPQPATLLALYYCYFNGYGDAISNSSFSIQLSEIWGNYFQQLRYSSDDMPSFFAPNGPHAFIIPPMREQFEFLSQQSKPRRQVLVNTFEALESEALKAISEELKIFPIGPLNTPYSNNDNASLDEGNLFQVTTDDYIGWLNSKPDSSVVYISFGSICVLSERQEDEILNGLLESGRPFLWATRSERKLLEEGSIGKIVSWCCQKEVLNHRSLGCFVTHCGWNSTIESLSFGVPMVAFPQQIDQPTNAKLVEDLWKTGVRVRANNAEGIVDREEIKRCLDLVMMDNNNNGVGKQEMKQNVKKWKELAREASSDGGSSILNLQTFLADIDASRFA